MNKKELIMDMPVWDVRCWLQGLNEGEYLKVIKEGKAYTNADDLFDEIVIYGNYERSIEDGNILTVVYKNGEVITLEGIYKNILDKVKEDHERIQRHSEETKAYDLLNKLYKEVPEEFRDKINFSKKTIFVDDIALGTIDDIKDIGCWNGKICRRNDNETTEFDKFISIDKISSYRNIFFTYKDSGECDCEIIEELEKGKIYGRNENGQVVEVLR
ncbi:hypothetical protein DV092_06040 [Clostridium botulinum]|nr:hypothetical protein [Clostridium botulinum]